MEFRYSNRIIRFTFFFVVSMALMEPYFFIAEKYIASNVIYWILDIIFLFFSFRLAETIIVVIEEKFNFFTKKGKCHIDKEKLVLHLGKKVYECNIEEEIEELGYIEEPKFKRALGSDWDKLVIKTKQKRLCLLARPNEKETVPENKELYKVFLMIRDGSALVRDSETNIYECYIPKTHSY